MKLPCLVAAAALALLVAAPMSSHAQNAAPLASSASTGGQLTVTPLIKAKRDVPIPAVEDGVLNDIRVVEGSRVREGDLLAQMDVRLASAALKVADEQYKVALQRSEDDVEGRYAEKAAGVAYVNWQRDVEANIAVANAVPEIQIRQKRLDFERAELQIEKAAKDQKLAIMEAGSKLAEKEAAQLAIDLRTIVAPFDGEVVTLFKHQSEWANPGEPILRLVQFDVLHAEFTVNAEESEPSVLRGRPVAIRVQRAGGKETEVKGHITYVSPLIDSTKHVLVRAEIENRQENGDWLVRVGDFPEMTIYLAD